MKTSTMGMVSAAILMVVACVGFGIAQAGEYRSEQPIISLEGMEAMEAVETGSLPACSYDTTLCFGDNDVNPYIVVQAREAVETGSLPACSYDTTLCFGDNDINPYIVSQAREAVETGAIPVTVPENSWLEEYGND
jgi:hypothetical protein